MASYDFQTQHVAHCTICQMGLEEEFEEMYVRGMKLSEIARELSEMYNIDVSEAMLKRHLRFMRRAQEELAFELDLLEPKIDLEQFKSLSDIDRAKLMIKELDVWILQIGQVIGAFTTKKYFSMLRTYASAIQALGRVLEALTRFRDQLAERIERREGIDSNELFEKFKELFTEIAIANGMAIEEDGEKQDDQSKTGNENG